MDCNRFVLVSDLDGTLLGHDDALEAFAEWYESRRDCVRLIYATGRFLESVRDEVDSTPLPAPEAVVGGVGAEIRSFQTGEPLFGWADSFRAWDAGVVRDALAPLHGLELQPDEYQSSVKVSYFADANDQRLLDDVSGRLANAGIEAELIASAGEFIDVLPVGVSKGAATAFLATALGLAPEEIVVSGDSGNDLSMFRTGYRGIVVANAHPELKSERGPDIYHSTFEYAAGVLDGIAHWVERAGRPASTA